MAFVVLLSLNTVRLLTGELVLRDAVAAAQQETALGLLHMKVEIAKHLAPEDARLYLLLGQEFFAASVSAETGSREALSGMSRFELAASVRRNPADGAAWLGLALISPQNTGFGNADFEAGAESARLAEKAVRRRPGHAENAWVYARSLPNGSEAQAEAYQLTSRLEPRLTPKIVNEIRFMAGDVTAQARFIAPLASCYRYWAWSVTSPVEGNQIARMGLTFRSGKPEPTRVDHAWLHYYLGLKLAESSRNAQALPWFEKALGGLANEHAFYRNYGFALLKSGAPREATVEFQASIELYPDLANASYLGLAQAAEALGEKATAVTMYRRLTSNPRLEAWVRAEAGGGIYRLENMR